MTPSQTFPPIEELLPHRDPMLLLDRVLAADAHSLTAERTVPAGAWHSDEAGAMPLWIGLELMAQAVAAHVSLQARLRGAPPKRGVLLGTKSLRATRAAAPAGSVLHVSARLVYRDDSGLGAYDCAIAAADGTGIAQATLKVFEPADFDAFLQEATS